MAYKLYSLVRNTFNYLIGSIFQWDNNLLLSRDNRKCLITSEKPYDGFSLD